jgi:hypothetical protein
VPPKGAFDEAIQTKLLALNPLSRSTASCNTIPKWPRDSINPAHTAWRSYQEMDCPHWDYGTPEVGIDVRWPIKAPMREVMPVASHDSSEQPEI